MALTIDARAIEFFWLHRWHLIPVASDGSVGVGAASLGEGGSRSNYEQHDNGDD